MGINSEVLMMAQTLDNRYGRHYEWRFRSQNALNTYNLVFYSLQRNCAEKGARG